MLGRIAMSTCNYQERTASSHALREAYRVDQLMEVCGWRASSGTTKDIGSSVKSVEVVYRENSVEAT
jgi:hypothetical protein